jgi:hypothetical protein
MSDPMIHVAGSHQARASPNSSQGCWRRSAPAPFPDTPESRTERDEYAVDFVAALKPANSRQADLAVQIVVIGAQCDEQLRLATRSAHDPDIASQYRHTAAGLMSKEAKALKALLARQTIHPWRRRRSRPRRLSAPP